MMITHEPDLAARAQRIVQIRDGRIVDGVDGSVYAN
jgi:predicted ABC-type transport system involved in lysophospholipase L1 biosynthesis ATPase subunit